MGDRCPASHHQGSLFEIPMKTIKSLHTHTNTHLSSEVGDSVGVNESSSPTAEQWACAGCHTGWVGAHAQWLPVRAVFSATINHKSVNNDKILSTSTLCLVSTPQIKVMSTNYLPLMEF